MHGNWNRAVLTGCVLLLATGLAGAAGPEDLPVVASRDLGHEAALAPVGGHLRLENVVVAETGELTAFVMERFEVFAPDATITVHGAGGERVLPAPRNAYFRGTVDGQPRSRVFLAVLEDGSTQGIVNGEDGETYLIGGDTPETKALALAPLAMRQVGIRALDALPAGGGFTCGNDRLPQDQKPLGDLDLGAAPPEAAVAEPAALPLYRARVAIETDFEFYSKFNSVTNATNYVGNLLGYASTIYSNEINTTLQVQSTSLWTTSGDPWGQTSTLCGLMEFGRYWNLNKTGVSRTIAHFLSGKSLGGGVAWVGVLCSGAFGGSATCPGLATDAPWGGGYGFTANITGAFNINNPTVVWDIMAVSHEIGHNFNSPHSHCYNNLGGNPSPIDQCYAGECANGCNCNSAALPGAAGTGSGTIMSYCHLLSPGMSNVSLNFGTSHPSGVVPGREAARMSAFVVSRALSSPSCLAVQANGIFSDGLESGNIISWQ
ncbi:MAG TPA: M12 family metallo-peptidase [Thermoanaerobaculia bacterium]|nr:M12 family metallo-peptidase [Thermoanaerobaculia bacterium]